MRKLNQAIVKGWQTLGPRFLPFADAATKELPLSRLLRLSLFQISLGMAMVLLTGTLNRVMIVELGVPAWIVGVLRSRCSTSWWISSRRSWMAASADSDADSRG